MEQLLRALFDYQRFENEPRLKAMIDDTVERYESSYEGELTDEEAGFLNAAGTFLNFPKPGADN